MSFIRYVYLFLVNNNMIYVQIKNCNVCQHDEAIIFGTVMFYSLRSIIIVLNNKSIKYLLIEQP